MKFRSKFEEAIYNNVQDNGLAVEYEACTLEYIKKGNYYADWRLPNGIIVESKGYFDARSRAKMIAVKKQNPDVDIRFVFMNSKNKIGKNSKMTYADWSDKHGFPYADGMIPLKWFEEKST